MMSGAPPWLHLRRVASGLMIVVVASIILGNYGCCSQSVIESLPGFPGNLPFTLETGYIGVGETKEVQLFYYFIESESDPEEDPLVLWLTGGPGCSALSGLIYEIGPFTIDYAKSDGNIPALIYNEYSWTKVANIIFLDQPVGTGYSYANTSEAYKTSDTLSAIHTHDFLIQWLIQHPEYQENPLYISGDSYAGILVPLVADEVYKGIEAGIKPLVNIKGYTLGNAATDSFIDNNGKIEYIYRMGLISKPLYQSTNKNCHGDYIHVDPDNILCQNDLEKIQRCLDRIIDAQILEPWCETAFEAKRSDSLFSHGPFYDEIPSNFIIQPIAMSKKSWCRHYNYAFSRTWANNKIVQRALNVREGTITEWARCNNSLANITANLNNPMSPYDYNVRSTLEYHRKFSNKTCRALIYSGDHDLKIPHTTTEKWIDSLNFPVQSDWRPWLVEDQFGGYTMRYSHGDYELTYATVRGAGHTAPEYKPKECLTMIKRWFDQSPL